MCTLLLLMLPLFLSLFVLCPLKCVFILAFVRGGGRPSAMENPSAKTKTVYDIIPCLKCFGIRKKYICLWNFTAKTPEEIELKEKEKVYILKEYKRKRGLFAWSEVEKCRRPDQYGLIPRSYLVDAETYNCSAIYDGDWYLGKMDPLEASKLLLEQTHPIGTFVVCAPETFMDRNFMWEEFALLIRIRRQTSDPLQYERRRRTTSRRTKTGETIVKQLPTQEELGKDQVELLFGRNKAAMIYTCRIRRDSCGRYIVNPGDYASNLYTLISMLKENPGYLPVKPRKGIGSDSRLEKVPAPPSQRSVEPREREDPKGTVLTASEKRALLSPFGLKKKQLELLGNIGFGHFAEVQKGIWHGPGGVETDVAVKKLKSKATSEEFREEAINLARIGNSGHKNMIKFYGFCDESKPYWIVLEYMPGGSLPDYIRKHGLTDRQKVEVMYQIAAVMSYLEDLGIVHRDLAARNCLVGTGKQNELIVKISDFGLAHALSDKHDKYATFNKEGGKKEELPWKWMAPEAIRHREFSSKSDVWSFGCLICEILDNSGERLPYYDSSPEDIVEDLLNKEVLPYDYMSPPQLYNIAKKCWEYDPESRPSFRKLTADFANILFDNVKKFVSETFTDDTSEETGSKEKSNKKHSKSSKNS